MDEEGGTPCPLSRVSDQVNKGRASSKTLGVEPPGGVRAFLNPRTDRASFEYRLRVASRDSHSRESHRSCVMPPSHRQPPSYRQHRWILLMVASLVAIVKGAPIWHYKFEIEDVLVRGIPTRNVFGTMSYLLGNLTSGEAAVRGRVGHFHF